MTTFYVDTSALIKRYIAEVGSAWVRRSVDSMSGNVVIICDVTPVEMFSVLSRLNRQRQLSASSLLRLQNSFLLHTEQEYLTISIDGQIFKQARVLVSRHKLRTLDALHLASAQYASTSLGEAVTFVTSDIDLKTSAIAEGFAVEDPLQHQ